MSVDEQILQTYAREVRDELLHNILPFTANRVVDREHGGFYGYVANDGTPDSKAPKGQVQHTRVLWAFAHAQRRLGDLGYGALIEQARAEQLHRFWDDQYGGLFWTVTVDGTPLRTDKLADGQAYGIYSFAEDYLASGSVASLEHAIALYRLLERHARDRQAGGYFDAFGRDWHTRASLNVDESGPAAIKSMNAHLHLLEAYTLLLQAWDDAALRASLEGLIHILLDQIIDRERGHFRLLFDADWRVLSNADSYGHDLEGSWLLVAAIDQLGNAELAAEVRAAALAMARAVYAEGRNPDGSVRNDSTGPAAIWWGQAEGMVGFFNAYQLSGDARFLDASLACWRYVQAQLIDPTHGDWFWGRDEAGAPLPEMKAGLWKTPYHNARACLEIMRRVTEILA